MTEREAARMRRDELKHVIARKKLYLVLDLDHTLLNSARFIEVPPDEEAYLTACYSKARSAKSEQASGSHRGASGEKLSEDIVPSLSCLQFESFSIYIHVGLSDLNRSIVRFIA